MRSILFVTILALNLTGCSDEATTSSDSSTVPSVGGAGGMKTSASATFMRGGGQSFGGSFSLGGSIATGGRPHFDGGSIAVGGAVPKGGSNATGEMKPLGAGGAASSNSAGGASSVGVATGGIATGGKIAVGGMSTGGGSTSGFGGSTSGYQPCPTDGTPCKILPLGDSITWGVGDEPNGGYRGPLFALALAAGQKITFTGSLSNGPGTVSGQTFPKKNEGHSGWGISTVTTYSGGNAGIATLIPTPAFASGSGGVPHIVLLMIGTNDSTESTSTEMTSRLSALMDKIITGAPNALLVVAKIPPLSWASTISAYNNSITGLVQARVTAGNHVTIADMNKGFNTTTMFSSDNIHPNTTGYQFMADRWYSVISEHLHQ